MRHISDARSHACHMGWWCVGGRRGYETGVQFAEAMMRSARRKLRKRDATSRSCGQHHKLQVLAFSGMIVQDCAARCWGAMVWAAVRFVWEQEVVKHTSGPCGGDIHWQNVYGVVTPDVLP